MLRFVSGYTDNDSATQPARPSFVFSKAHSNNPKENASDGFMISASTCYTLHGILVMMHIFLLISYISHWEHRVTLPFTSKNNDVWSVVLSASLQAFYTIYTAVLLFLTQRLAISRILARRLKLTSIHDISGAWSGLGSALSSVWQQIDIPASWWMTLTVTTYLVCISALHITSSTLLQWQTFNTSMLTSASTTLGWRDNLLLNTSQSVNWASFAASLPVVNQLPGLASAGLSYTTIYDIPQTSPMIGNATVNATTMSSHCGLLSNVTYNANTSIASALTTSGYVLPFTAPIPWPNLIQVLQLTADASYQFEVVGKQPGIYLMVSTLLEAEASIQEETSVPMTWAYGPDVNQSEFTSFDMKVYFVECSLSTATAQVTVDIQTNGLWDPVPVPQQSTQWELYQGTSDSNTWQGELGVALAIQVSSGMQFSNDCKPSIVDEYIMSLVGLNLTALYYAEDLAGTGSNATFVLGPDKLEAAIAQAAAQLVWIAGRVGAFNGGLDIGNGTAKAVKEIIELRLNVNCLPLLFATSASVIMLGLALNLTGAFDASYGARAVIPNTGTLQLLWLGCHSSHIHGVLEDVEHPTDANLRRAGMMDVYFVKKVSDEESQLSARGSIDSLSCQVGHNHDDRKSY